MRPSLVADEVYEDESGSEDDFDGSVVADKDEGDESDNRSGSEVDSEDEHFEDARSQLDDGDDTGEEGGNVQDQMNHVSFGALKQAQETMKDSRKRKRGLGTNGNDEEDDQEGKLEVLRKRLRELKERQGDVQIPKSNTKTRTPVSTLKTTDAKATKDDAGSDQESNSDFDSDSAPSEEGAPTLSRSSKHAPAAQSSRHQVTRKRNVIEVPKRIVRDPRFDALHQHSHAHHPSAGANADKAYSFLRDYQKSEIQELKAVLKKSKSDDDKITLRRKINSMENRIKAKDAKEREQEVLRRHRKEERERVEQGKTPFFLKKKEVKEQALVEKFKGMKGKERTKLVEKRRKKEGQKEKKRMPEMSRRAA